MSYKRSDVRNIFWIFLSLESLIIGILIKISGYFRCSLFRRWYHTIMPDPDQFGLKYNMVSFPSRDGLNLRGWWFPTRPDRPVIILLHGFRANRADPPERVFGIARELIDQEYNVLTFDFRAHGESEGERVTAGYSEKNDLLGAIHFIRQNGITGKIGVLGFSMGAAISLLTAAESKDIAAVVADSSFVDVTSLIQWKLSRWQFLSRLIIPILVLATRIIYHFDFTRVKPVDAIKILSIPVFIIHGGKDHIIPVSHAYKLKNACHSRTKFLWVVPEADHTGAFSIHSQEYLSRISKFFSRALAPG